MRNDRWRLARERPAGKAPISVKADAEECQAGFLHHRAARAASPVECLIATLRVYSTEQAKQAKGASIRKSRAIVMKIRLAIVLLLFFSPGTVLPLSAHHSSSSYDMEHPVNVKGIITKVEWTNPHVFIFLTVKDDSGNVEEWRVEGNSPNMLSRVGWKPEMLKVGETLDVKGAAAKSGSKVMRLITLTLANGEKFDGQGFK